MQAVLSHTNQSFLGELTPSNHANNRCSTYFYGFNGKEMVNDWNGNTGATYDYGFRIYDSRLGKFLSVDPLTKDYPWYTPYQFAGNKPIWAVDLDGLEEYYTSSGELIGKYGTSTEIRVVYDDYVEAATEIVSNQNNPGSDVMNDVLYNKGSAGVFKSDDAAAIDWGSRHNKESIDTDTEMG
jgi:RHS repeat-associated protein